MADLRRTHRIAAMQYKLSPQRLFANVHLPRESNNNGVHERTVADVLSSLLFITKLLKGDYFFC